MKFLRPSASYLASKGTIAQTAFQDVLRVKIGARAIIIHNVDVLDGITNGQLGVIIDFVKTTSGSVDKIVFKPQDTSIGQNNRYTYLKACRKCAVII